MYIFCIYDSSVSVSLLLSISRHPKVKFCRSLVALFCHVQQNNMLWSSSDLCRRADLPSSSHRCTARARCRSREHSRDTAGTRHRVDPASRSYTCHTQRRGGVLVLILTSFFSHISLKLSFIPSFLFHFFFPLFIFHPSPLPSLPS